MTSSDKFWTLDYRNGQSAAFVSTSSLNGGTILETALSAGENLQTYATIGSTFAYEAPGNAKARITTRFSGLTQMFGDARALLSVSAYVFDSDRSNPPLFQKEYSFDWYGATRGGKDGARYFARNISFDLRPGEYLDLKLTALAQAGLTGRTGYVSTYLDPVVSVGGVPEPAAWAVMVAGFGAVGAAARRRRRVPALAA